MFEGTPVLLTRQIHEAVTRGEIEGVRCGLDAVHRLYPQEGATSLDIAGGLAAFAGAESPLSQAYGIGTRTRVGAEEISRITAFYQSRNAVPRIFVAPLADPSLEVALVAKGYRPAEYENVLVCDDFSAALHDDRIAVASDSQAWARASAEAFTTQNAPGPADTRIAMVLASSEGVCALQAREGDVIVATAAMDVRGEWSALFAGSTISNYRNRGWHTAMIRDRMARARAAGARLLRATAKPNSVSERNFRRCGFTVLSTRALWELRT